MMYDHYFSLIKRNIFLNKKLNPVVKYYSLE